uniref:Sodium/hydrogen exchanger 8 n=1 Tax=Micrurus surinamensis TaxID=129470 RepID=A0A2D4PKI0_MICSU
MTQTDFPNVTHDVFNFTLHTTLALTTKLVLPTPAKPILPVQTGVQAQQEEQSSGMTIFFSLLVLAICIILVHLLIRYRLHFLPESVAVVSLGILMGAVIKIIESQKLANWKEEEMFRPNMFFLLLLPPIIFESGYSLHKGNFFQNIGSITLFSVIGTAISAFIVGGGIYFLGQADVIYKLNMTDSFAFGSLISAVDPVATIAIFNALNVDPVLNMLVFGESILNDAVSIVLTK